MLGWKLDMFELGCSLIRERAALSPGGGSPREPADWAPQHVCLPDEMQGDWSGGGRARLWWRRRGHPQVTFHLHLQLAGTFVSDKMNNHWPIHITVCTIIISICIWSSFSKTSGSHKVHTGYCGINLVTAKCYHIPKIPIFTSLLVRLYYHDGKSLATCCFPTI